jgi:hypothetical protein
MKQGPSQSDLYQETPNLSRHLVSPWLVFIQSY